MSRDFIKTRLDVEQDALRRTLRNTLRDQLHRVSSAIDDLDAGERIDSNLFGNAGIISGDVARWNLTRELLPMCEEVATPAPTTPAPTSAPSPEPTEPKRRGVQKMKMWIGNYDGDRQGAVVARSKTRAARIAGASYKDFNDYWTEQAEVDKTLTPATLYTRPMRPQSGGPGPWQKGRCP